MISHTSDLESAAKGDQEVQWDQSPDQSEDQTEDQSVDRPAEQLLDQAEDQSGDEYLGSEDERLGVIDVLRFFGLARRTVPRPILGRKAYVRWWERLRASVVLVAIVIGMGFLLAAIVGVIVLGAGFLLEQAIS